MHYTSVLAALAHWSKRSRSNLVRLSLQTLCLVGMERGRKGVEQRQTDSEIRSERLRENNLQIEKESKSEEE